MSHAPRSVEDAKHVSLIALCGLLGAAATAGLVTFLVPPPAPPVVEATPAVVEPPVPAVVEAEPVPASDRMYGRVVLTSGEELTGALVWNGAEASWADRLPATRPGGGALAGLRFGHISRIVPGEGSTIVAALKSGELVRLTPTRPLRGGSPVSLQVEASAPAAVDVPWSDVDRIELLASAPGDRPRERLHGTVVTRSGLELTGYLSWNRDQSFDDEDLTGSFGAVPFSMLASIRREADDGVFIRTTAGVTAKLSGTEQTGLGNHGIVVADPALGSVLVPFHRFHEVTLHPPVAAATYDAFDGGRELRGTVKTTDGRTLTGRIRWDRDEAATWEMLYGQNMDVQFHVELGRVAWIEKKLLGATVALRDGRSFYLLGSNDVNWSNRGIEVTDASGAVTLVPWSDFERVRFDD